MGRFFSSSPEDSTQLHLLSLPGEKTSLKEAGGGGIWTGPTSKSSFSLHEKGSHPGHPTEFAAVFGLSDAESLALADGGEEGVGPFKSSKRC